MTFFSSLFRKTASNSQNKGSQNTHKSDRSRRSANRASSMMMDSVGRFEMND